MNNEKIKNVKRVIHYLDINGYSFTFDITNPYKVSYNYYIVIDKDSKIAGLYDHENLDYFVSFYITSGHDIQSKILTIDKFLEIEFKNIIKQRQDEKKRRTRSERV